jgi:transcriptional regulator with XRE-family HTH domain
VTPADLRAAREALGLTQKELGQRLSVAENTIHRWERGTMPIEHPLMLRLALDRLVCISEVPHAPPGSPPVQLIPPTPEMRSR